MPTSRYCDQAPSAIRASFSFWASGEPGFKVALDDIDPETSNLCALLELSFFAIKLDGRLVNRLDHDPGARAFVTKVVGQMRPRGTKLIAEGVETQEIATCLQSLGVDYVQGFLISRPMQDLMLPA